MKIMSIDKRKSVVTLVVTGFFIFFWINGPLSNAIEMQFERNENTDIVKPVLVGEEKKVAAYNTIDDMETSGDGFAIILEAEEDSASGFAVLETQQAEIQGTDYGKAMLANAKKHFDQKAKFRLEQTEAYYYVSIQSADERYYYFQSKGITDEIKGYSGPINVGVFMHEDGFLHKMVHVSSIETESYLKKIARTNYFEQYNHLPMDKTNEIDAITGATISSKAMAMTTSELVSQLYPFPLSDIIDKNGINNFKTNAVLRWYWIPHIGVIFILFLYAFQKKLRKSKRYVVLTSLASVVFIGFYLNDSFTYVTFIHPFIGTTLSSFMGLYALFVLLGAIWGKNTYCKYICPYGNIQRLQIKVWKGASRKFPVSNKWIKRIRFFILILLIAGILAGFRNLSHLEPYPYVFGVEYQSLWFFIFAVAALLVNWLYPMIWCRLLCPTGSILDTLSAISEKTIKKSQK